MKMIKNYLLRSTKSVTHELAIICIATVMTFLGFTDASAITVPNQINGLYAWYSSDAFTGLTEDNSITSWLDESGNNRDLYATYGTTTYSSTLFNGHPTLMFNHSIMSSSASFGMGGDAEFTLFVVGSFGWPGNSINGYGWPVMWGAPGIAYRGMNVELDGDNGGRLDLATGWYRDANSDYFGSWGLDKPNVISFRRSVGSPLTNSLIRVDGVSRSVSGDIGVPDFDGTKSFILNYDASLNMKLAEVILYSRQLTQEEELAVGSYISEKYDLTNGYPVPEPSTLIILCASAISLLAYACRRR
jgi:hypothetical protein